MGSKKKSKPEIQDEPGAEERFKGILKRALNTPPPRKREGKAGKTKKPTKRG